ncbi:phosphoadenosine phosphosulfate reductase [Shimia sp. CNT1-13L.2]|uniref:phosphoadenosine phosphosulfate reductase n=1 Tax=Shimia sp. CNT1-13L.2 TaxID=2959663 RepID=UPI0020CBBA8C|nr:phosphoadenosine phosphosulfate reductase [Shimia sp. CNT1-13L.2]MCP9480974.1 phosphoadenosine phosphosulfate reductase [Shimia sp. CNT1-13L.2]
MNETVAIDASQAETQADWKDNLREIGAREGFYEELGAQHTALFVERGKTLIVTFENLDHVYGRAADRMPWGFGFVEQQGWSMLGMMASDWTWYRDDAVHDFFDRLRDEGFFEKFDKVVFYGASMGAYAASVFSAAAPGCQVVAISPQATLNREITPWEQRYRKAWRRDYTGRYGYGPEMSASAEKVHLFYDPRNTMDSMHAALFQGDNVVKYRCRFMGHRIASLWIQLGLLKPIVTECVSGEMTTTKFYQWMRARRENSRFQKEMLQTLQEMQRPRLLIRYCEAVLARRRAPHFRNAMKAARASLKGKK